MFDSITVSQIKEYADRGHRVGEIAAAFQITRQAVANIVKGQTHANVRPAGHVKGLDKMAEVVAAAKRRAHRDAERERKKQEETAAKALAAVLDADLFVLDARRSATDLNSAMKATHSTQEYKDLKAALDEVIRKGNEAGERAKARAGL